MESTSSATRSQESHLTQSGAKRQRIRQACKPCHALKAKCSGAIPACERCCQKGIRCEYTVPQTSPRTRKRRKATPAAEKEQINPLPSPVEYFPKTQDKSPLLETRPESTCVRSTAIGEPNRVGDTDELCTGLGLNKHQIRLLIDAYFEHVAPLWENGFIHRALFLRAWTTRMVDPVLLKSICSASATFVSTDVTALARRDRWRAEAEAYIWSNVGKPSMTVLQVLVVVISQNCVLSRFATLQPLLGIASKMAFLLRLNHENPRLSTTAQEIRRRIMWSIFILERRLAAGQADLVSCSKDRMHIRLPSSERDFELAIPRKSEALVSEQVGQEDSTSMGSRAYLCRISNIRHEVLQYTRRVISESNKADDSRSELHQLECDLLNLKDSLPGSMQFSDSNLRLRAYSPHFNRYVMLHIMWHQCHCDLYRFTLPGLRESLPSEALHATSAEYVSYCQSKAIEHAIALIKMFKMVQSVCDETIHDPGIATCVYQCTRIIIRALDLGLLGSRSTGLETLLDLQNAAKILVPIVAVNQSTNQFYITIQTMIHTARSRASHPGAIAQALRLDQTCHTNILDILAQIRQRDFDKGEEVLRLHPPSPPETTPSDHEARSEAIANETGIRPTFELTRVSDDLDDTLWYTEFELENTFGSLDSVFDHFGAPSLEFNSQDLEPLYTQQ